MDCSTPALPVHHQLPEFTQTHVYWVGDAIQPSHPLSSPFSSCLQSFPASGSFQMSQLFASGGQSTGVSALTSVLPMNIQDWFPLGWTDCISLQSKGLSRVFSNTTVQKHHDIKTTHHTNLGHFAKVMPARSLHYKSLFLPFLHCTLWEWVTKFSQHLNKSGEWAKEAIPLYLLKWGVHKLFITFLKGRCVTSSFIQSLICVGLDSRILLPYFELLKCFLSGKIEYYFLYPFSEVRKKKKY